MSEFSEVFFEEASEHLREMEELLLGCDVDQPDADALNAIFRAAHSIKGGAGAFGFGELTGVTHVLETLLDRVRKRECRLTVSMIDAFLRARDVLAAIVAAHREARELPREDIASITATLETFSADGADKPVAPVVPERPDQQDSAYQPDQMLGMGMAPAYPEGCLQVRIAAGAPIDDAGVLSCLNSYGTVIEHEQGGGESPWRYVCETLREASDIYETLTFLINPDRLTIDSDDPPTDANHAEIWEEEYDGYGLFVPAPHRGASAGGRTDELSRPYTDTVVAKLAEPLVAVASPSVPARAGPAAAAVEPPKHGAAPAANGSSIRVSVEKVDQLLNLVGELVITQSMLAQTAADADGHSGENLSVGLGQLERNSRELQEAVMSIRMVPISSVFNRFPRVVRDLAKQLGKEVDLFMEGEHTELDKGFVEKLTDPMMHLVRNSVDHGIETPDVRERGGKSRRGRLTLRAYQQGSDIAIEVADDGAGLDCDRIIAKAKESGLQVSDAISEREIWMLIFEPGFSTASTVTDISGRGVGMDVVRRNIQEMGGRIDIESVPGAGTTLTIRLPLTLAILDGMSVRVDGERYIVPLAFITEAVMPEAGSIQSVQGTGRVINVRGEFLPLRSLPELLGCECVAAAGGLALILKSDTQKVALCVDELLGQHQVVIKNLEANYRRVPGVAGATIMGDGKVALILDVMSLMVAGRSQPASAEPVCA
ncbi:chemotaxis protein CheA [Burkholderia ubonensis]|uniref:chemotaxis protein CheA n=1 Tax=Burkholderia ubonensis TaxID=101571 RepID=UPI000755199A|nr:chemotaxis protein CheA [Burkholderia ubonensis]KWB79433.1 chemotaxis protein CheA [Burkholderia ubonensis]